MRDHRVHAVLFAAGVAGVAAAATAARAETIEETVYVETALDTDHDGKPDRIYLTVSRPTGGSALPTVYTVSPYSLGGNDVANHGVDVARLPQDEDHGLGPAAAGARKTRDAARTFLAATREAALARGYAAVAAHSLGTGRSTGCPSVGDDTEAEAAKTVIDWLNGRARAFDGQNREVKATWANGKVGMTGVSYDGTLPNMVAATGVAGLEAIVPVSAITSWYDYYRANGLVVSPDGYAGEDADVLGKYIVRPTGCAAAIDAIARTMGRETGDFTRFWQDRDYIARAASVHAAVFIMHGQSDWNVRQRHAIRWWEALSGQVPLRMWLGRGGHGYPDRSDVMDQTYAWFDRYVKGMDNGVENSAPVEVESPAGAWAGQQAWPHERTAAKTLYLNAAHALAAAPAAAAAATFTDAGKTRTLEDLVGQPTGDDAARLAFVTAPFAAATKLSGTGHVRLTLAVQNRHAANVTVAVVDYDAGGDGTVVTRGWADPQNHADLAAGEPLALGQSYELRFDLEPKQYDFAAGHRLGVVVASTDYDHTIRPDAGTRLAVTLGEASSVELGLSGL